MFFFLFITVAIGLFISRTGRSNRQIAGPTEGAGVLVRVEHNYRGIQIAGMAKGAARYGTLFPHWCPVHGHRILSEICASRPKRLDRQRSKHESFVYENLHGFCTIR